jgi:hypothetical protein
MPHVVQDNTSNLYDIRDYYNIYSGIGVLNNAAKYLRRPIKETPRSFRDRSRWASFPNWSKKAHTIYMGYIFASKPKIVPSPEFCILKLAQASAHHALIGGFCWIIVLASGPAVYRGDSVIEQGKGIFKVHGKTESFLIDFKKEIIEHSDGKTEPFQADQLILVTWNEDRESLFVDIAPMNIELFNLNSIKKYHIIKSMHWFLTGPDSKDEPEPYDYVPLKTDDAPLTFVQPDNSTLIDTINRDITEIILNMGSILGISSEFARELKFQAGISKMIDLIDTNSTVRQIASNIAQAVNMAAAAFVRLRGGTLASIQIDPILRPTEDTERLQALQTGADFINVPDVNKILQKEYLKIILPGWTIEELQPLFEKIMSASGETFNPLRATTLMEGV